MKMKELGKHLANVNVQGDPKLVTPFPTETIGTWVKLAIVYHNIQLKRKKFTKYEDKRPLDSDFTGIFPKSVLIGEVLGFSQFDHT